MQLNIIGSAGSYPAPASTCSSYLVRSEKTSILLDAGNGSQSHLYGVIEPGELSAVVISHSHMDHFADLIGIYHYLKYAFPPKSPIPIFSTGEVLEKVKYLVGPGLIDRSIFNLNEIAPGSEIQIDHMLMRFYHANHPVPTLITRLRDHYSSMCYGADGDLSEGLLAASKDSDLLLGESTWVERTDNFPTGLHLDALSLALLAQRSRARQLVITHVAYPADKSKILEIVKKNYAGASHLAEDGLTFSF
ncbi:MAG: MBL fold metallo-hydrolase [Actinomycetota bacterium]|nr:MBL fold metallo-hydrolase [Actinomycetota bacterium]